PRPRRFAASSVSISCSGVSFRAFGTWSYPPIARYSESFVRSRSSAPARSTLRAPTDLLHDRGDVVGLDVLAVAAVDGDDGGVPAPAEALDGPEGDLPVVGGLAGIEPELALERVHHALGADESAGQVRADLDQVLADWLEVEHVVERRDPVAVGR